MNKKHGLMGALESAGLVESDITPTGSPHQEAQVAPPQPAYMAAPASYAAPVTLNAEDQERLRALEAQVYATPSSYVIFQKTRAAMAGMDAPGVFKVLEVANPGVTPAKVLADIDTHLGIIQSKRQDFDSQIARARADRIDVPTQQINDMTAQIAALNAKIAQLQPGIQSAMASIADGSARFKAVEDQLTAPLLQAKQLLTSLA